MPELTFTFGSILVVTGVIAGVRNAVAGGGTFFTFPAVLASGPSSGVSEWLSAGKALGLQRALQRRPRLHAGHEGVQHPETGDVELQWRGPSLRLVAPLALSLRFSRECCCVVTD